VNDQLAKLYELGAGAWRYRWVGLLSAWAIAVLGVVLVGILPNTYESRARVYVDTESVLQPLLQGITVQRGTDTQLRMMASTLTSRRTLLHVIDNTDLKRSIKNETDRERMLKKLGDTIQVDNAGSNNTFTIAYESSKPQLAQQVVDNLLQVFMTESLGLRRSDSGVASEVLQQQIAEYERRLRIAEEKLAEFKKENVGLMPNQAGDYFTRLQSAITATETLVSQIRQAETRRQELQRQLTGERPTYGMGNTAEVAAIDSRIGQASTKLEQLLTQYTDKHPEVVALRTQIARMYEERAAAEQSLDGGSAVVSTTGADGRSTSLLNVNPIYQNLRLQLTQTNAELADLRGRLAEQQRAVGEMRSKVDVIPDVEAQLAQLNRDYEVNRAQYTALLQRLESARISGEVGESADKKKFQVIEAPVVPVLPISPKRSFLLLGVTIFSLGAGFAAALGLHFLNPAFFSAESLAKFTSRPVLGAISDIDHSPQKFWLMRPVPSFAIWAGGILVFIAGSAVLIGRYAPFFGHGGAA
jgi:polysaccharide chain length determinant protein (PEP-CTERM system associated)